MRANRFSPHWQLDPSVTFLNHGSFGATPTRVLEVQNAFRRQMEAEPVRFFVRELEPLLDVTRERVGTFVGADPEDVVFVPNATAGVNAVLRSLKFREGDELLTTNHEYNASKNALDFVAARSGARVVVADIPFPISSSDEALQRVVEKMTPWTRLLLVDHITSPTALVLPVEAMIAEARSRGIEVLVDGAHGPGMLPLDMRALGATYYTGNFHKWVCAPKGAAFLYVRRDRQKDIRPTSISHGANSTRTDRSRFLIEYDWTGTADFTAILSVPAAIDTIEELGESWRNVLRNNHNLVLRGRDVLCRALGVPPPAPDSMLGSMASVPLPDGSLTEAPSLYGDPLQDRLLETHSIEVPVVPWPAAPKRLVRISAQLYNDPDEYWELAGALMKELGREK